MARMGWRTDASSAVKNAAAFGASLSQPLPSVLNRISVLFWTRVQQ